MSDDETPKKPMRTATQFMTGRLTDEPLPPTPPGGHRPDLQIELGPQMTAFVRETPLDAEAKEQIDQIIANPAMEELRRPLVSVALMNCIDRRVAEMEAAATALKSLRAKIEKAGRAG